MKVPLSMSSPPPTPCPKEMHLKGKNNKSNLTRVLLSIFNAGEYLIIETRDDAEFGHDEADITMISYVTEAAKSGNNYLCLCCWSIGGIGRCWSGGMGQCCHGLR